METSNEVNSAERITNVFRGNASSEKELNVYTNLVKIFVSSSGSDFPHERQRLFSVVLPALQNHFRPHGLDIQFVDSFCSNYTSLADSITLEDHLLKAQLLNDQLTEIAECHRLSPTCFLLCLIGNKYGHRLLPHQLSSRLVSQLVEMAQLQGDLSNVNFLSDLYEEDTNALPAVHLLKTTPHDTDDTESSHNEEKTEKKEKYNVKHFFKLYNNIETEDKKDQDRIRLKSAVDAHLHYAIDHLTKGSSQPILCVQRLIEGCNEKEVSSSAQAKKYFDTSEDNSSLEDNLIKTFQTKIKEEFKDSSNMLQFRIPWNDKGLEPEVTEFNNYLQHFCQEIIKKIKEVVSKIVSVQPELTSISKPVQDLYVECIGHLKTCQENTNKTDGFGKSDLAKPHLDQIRNLVRSNQRNDEWHGPIIIKGPDGSGKTSLLASVFKSCPQWFSKEPLNSSCTEFLEVVRVVRHLGRTPASVYSPLLVQNLFGQISLAFNLTITQIHPNMDLTELCSHLQEAIEKVSQCNNGIQLVVLLDDVQELKHPRFEEVVLSGFLPWNLPSNVHLICSINCGSSADEGSKDVTTDTKLLNALQNHPLIKHQIIDLSPSSSSSGEIHSSLVKSIDAILNSGYRRRLQDDQKQWLSTVCHQCPTIPLIERLLVEEVASWKSCTLLPSKNSYCVAEEEDYENHRQNRGEDNPTSKLTSLEAVLKLIFKKLEDRFGKVAISRVAQHLCCTLYGLAETEILELLSFTDDVFPCTNVRNGQTPTLVWSNIKNSMRSLLRETQVANRPLLAWKHRCIAKVAQQLYLSDKVTQATHSDIANLFLLTFISEKDSLMSSRPDLASSSNFTRTEIGRIVRRASLYNNTFDNDIKDIHSLRQIDQLWHHLLQARDIAAIKRVTVCNFEFLFAALCTVSVRYVLCILDIVRSQILDFEIDLLYYVIKLSMDILCKNPLQFAPVIISWLRSYKDMRLNTIETMVNQAMEWCDSHEEPLLVPLNTWVWNPVPEEALTLKCPLSIACFVLSRDNQAVIYSDREKAIHIYCLSSRKQLKTFTGHYGKVVCLHVSHTGKYLISGSEDTTTIVWDIHTSSIRHRISEHIATVTCVATTQNDALIISGSEDSRVLIADMETGKVVHKLEHHRGMISCLYVANDVDILITGAADSAVCVWSLDNFTLLNTLSFPCSVINMDVSNDRTFLLVVCEDNKLYLRSLTTGSEIHTIDGHDSNVLSVCIANDNCRALVGCENHQIYTYDLHSTKLLKVYSGHDGPITGVKVTENDGFLFTAGGNMLRVWYFIPDQDHKPHNKDQVKKQDNHSDVVMCVDISKDGTLGISGSADCTVKVWQLSNSELHSTLEAHTGPVTCVACAPSGLFAVSGSEDKTVRVWGLTLGHIVSAFKEHDATVTAVKVTSDSRKVLSADASGFLKLWQADNGTVTLSCRGSSSYVGITTNIKFAICGSGDNCIHIWTLSQDDKKHTVNHKEPILCHALTFDSKHLITGSRDKSLKVWEVITGRLTQVLVGHTAAVTCVDVAPLNRILVVSGSEDCNLIAWDMQTGHEVHTLSCHTDVVTCVQLTVDGHTTVSGSNDQTICVWETQSGQLVTLFNLHYSIINVVMSFDAGHIMVQLKDCKKIPLVCLHNCPPIDIQAYKRLEKAMEKESSLQAALPRKVHRRILQKEMSLDTYTWAKKYGNFPGKQHSFSSSLEDFTLMVMSPISSSTQNLHKVSSQSKTNLNQSEIFDELQAVWDGTDPTESRPQTPTQTGLYSSRRDHSISSMSSLTSTDLVTNNLHETTNKGLNGGHELPDLLANSGEDNMSILSEGNISAAADSGVCNIL